MSKLYDTLSSFYNRAESQSEFFQFIIEEVYRIEQKAFRSGFVRAGLQIDELREHLIQAVNSGADREGVCQYLGGQEFDTWKKTTI